MFSLCPAQEIHTVIAHTESIMSYMSILHSLFVRPVQVRHDGDFYPRERSPTDDPAFADDDACLPGLPSTWARRYIAVTWPLRYEYVT